MGTYSSSPWDFHHELQVWVKPASAFFGRENEVSFIYPMRFEVDSSYIQATLSELISINSVNPRLIPGAPGERQIATYVAGEMERLGLEVQSFEPDEGRVSIQTRFRRGTFTDVERSLRYRRR